MSVKLVTLIAPLNASGEGAPSEFRLLKAGDNDSEQGTLLFDAEAASSVMTRYQKRGIELMADYEHQSLNPFLTGPIPAAAKKWTPEVRNGDLMATEIKWTAKAKQMLADGEYRYFSIAARVDEDTSRVVEVINFGLTNNPAANSIEPLVAASLTHSAGKPAPENTMKTVVVALGLKADADEAEALAAVGSLKEFERNVLALSAQSGRGEALGALTAFKAKAERAEKAEGELVTLKAAQVQAEISGLIDAAVKDGRVAPAKREEIATLSKTIGLEGIKVFLSNLPRLISSADEAPREANAPSGDVESLSEIDIKIARVFTGGDPVLLKQYLADLRKYKAEQAEAKRSGIIR